MKKFHYAWAILASCCAISFAFGLTANSGGQYLVPILSELGFGMGEYQLSMTVRGVTSFISLALLNKMMDKINIRLLMSVCFAITLVGMILTSTFTRLWQWYALGIVMGFVGPPTQLIIPPIVLNNWFVKRKGFAIGLTMMFSGIGGAIMNPVLAWIIQTYNWRVAYIFNAAAVGVILMPFLLFIIVLKPSDKGLKPYGYEESEESGSLPDAGDSVVAASPADAEDSVDVASAVVAASLPDAEDPEGAGRLSAQDNADTAGVREGSSRPHMPPAGIAEAEPEQLSGVSRDRALRSVSFLFMLFIFGVAGFSGGFNQILTAYGISLGLAATLAAFLPSLSMLGNVTGKVVLGVVNDKFGGLPMMYTALGIDITAMLLLLAGVRIPLYLLLVGAFLAGNLLTLVSVATPLLTSVVYGERDYSKIYVTLSLGQSLIGTLCAPLIGIMYDMTGGFSLSFTVGVAVLVLSVCSVYLAYKTSRKLFA